MTEEPVKPFTLADHEKTGNVFGNATTERAVEEALGKPGEPATRSGGGERVTVIVGPDLRTDENGQK